MPEQQDTGGFTGRALDRRGGPILGAKQGTSIFALMQSFASPSGRHGFHSFVCFISILMKHFMYVHEVQYKLPKNLPPLTCRSVDMT